MGRAGVSQCSMGTVEDLVSRHGKRISVCYHGLMGNNVPEHNFRCSLHMLLLLTRARDYLTLFKAALYCRSWPNSDRRTSVCPFQGKSLGGDAL